MQHELSDSQPPPQHKVMDLLHHPQQQLEQQLEQQQQQVDTSNKNRTPSAEIISMLDELTNGTIPKTQPVAPTTTTTTTTTTMSTSTSTSSSSTNSLDNSLNNSGEQGGGTLRHTKSSSSPDSQQHLQLQQNVVDRPSQKSPTDRSGGSSGSGIGGGSGSSSSGMRSPMRSPTSPTAGVGASKSPSTTTTTTRSGSLDRISPQYHPQHLQHQYQYQYQQHQQHQQYSQKTSPQFSPNPKINHKKYDDLVSREPNFFLSTASIGSNRLRKSDTICKSDLNLPNLNFENPYTSPAYPPKNKSNVSPVMHPQPMTSARAKKLSKFFGEPNLAQDLPLVSPSVRNPTFLDSSSDEEDSASDGFPLTQILSATGTSNSSPSSPQSAPSTPQVSTWVTGESPARRLRHRAATTYSYADSFASRLFSPTPLAPLYSMDRSPKDIKKPTKLLIAKFLTPKHVGAGAPGGTLSGSGSGSVVAGSSPGHGRYHFESNYILPPSSRESLSSLMKDKIGYELFRAFCDKEHSLSNLLFLEDVDYFRHNTTSEMVQHDATKIFNRFLKQGVADELAVDSDLVTQVQNCLQATQQQVHSMRQHSRSGSNSSNSNGQGQVQGMGLGQGLGQGQHSPKDETNQTVAVTLDRTLFDKIYRTVKEDVTLDSFKRFCQTYQPSTAPIHTPSLNSSLIVPLSSHSWSGIGNSPLLSPSTSPSPSPSPPLAEGGGVGPHGIPSSSLHNYSSPISPQQSPRSFSSNFQQHSPRSDRVPNSAFSTGHHHYAGAGGGGGSITSPPLSPRISMIKPHFHKEKSSATPSLAPHFESNNNNNNSNILQTTASATTTLEEATQYGIAFGVKRGACKHPCDCIAYRPDGEQGGGPCLNCGHYPAQHKNLGLATGTVGPHSTTGKESYNYVDATTPDYESVSTSVDSHSSIMEQRNRVDSMTYLQRMIASGGGDNSYSSNVDNLNSILNSYEVASDSELSHYHDERDLNLDSPVSAVSNVFSPGTGTGTISSHSQHHQHQLQQQSIHQELDQRMLANFNNWTIDGDEIVFLNKLGEGTSAKVYKATWRNQEVAVKILKSTPAHQMLLDFLKELEIMSSLRSPHVVYFYGMVVQPQICMIMEYCSNQTLYHLMHTSMDFSWDWVLKFSIEMVKGIKCLHNWKPVIVHRDLKSLNLLVSDNWTIKVADFGLSRFATSKASSIRKTRGTYAYCAPEVYFGDYTVKGDIFSIGIIMWELIVRCMKARYERPFSEYKNIQYDFQILVMTYKSNLRPTIPANCPEVFANLVTMCWDADPEKRPTCPEILDVLQGLERQYQDNRKKWDKLREKIKKS
ncbi:hypothetical protein SAMD00019534_116400 [Acytostelium subglobosum LB1]|uniref:hypothetical protein n=1 Tax=Acytostelium subglobosum LB1 TaxID=1410327 RepID=UPI000644DCAC|nr:hypothetical protein SAMD00019534_116400 [Acytostelium subglobosum LB1]GAM28464.1 hypothetical protein SAMD00019534_116400 [Acytostelium subglobosum LB1]|eukprot:XP_012748503.1 hypothetical protein SAMD00019534_116400 [Acytostelium subglobosum LB1]